MVAEIENKKGQVAIFIILGMILVIIIILIFILARDNQTDIVSVSKNPQAYLEKCVGEEIEKLNEQILSNGGYVVLPTLTQTYLGKTMPFLCYSELGYARCIPTQPVIITHLTDEISININQSIKSCFNSLEQELIAETYSVDISEGDYIVSIFPEKIVVNIDKKIEFSGNEISRKIEKFKIESPSNIYRFAEIVHEIIRQESLYCNSDYPEIMRFNREIIISKTQIGKGIKIYTLIDKTTLQEFTFAVKGCETTIPR